jgi:hypothetical protein
MVKARLLSPFDIFWALTSYRGLKPSTSNDFTGRKVDGPKSLRAFAANPNTTNRLGPHPATIRSDGQIRYSTSLRNGRNRSDSAPIHSQQRATPYKALAELGKAIKTLFLCRYLHEETLRREIHEGLNVIEHWNGANDFVFFARHGELASNRTEDHELSMLSLHLLQNCMVYTNTRMMQQVLSRPHWAERLTTTNLRALTPLIWEHVNPYGRFELNMETRLDLIPNGP